MVVKWRLPCLLLLQRSELAPVDLLEGAALVTRLVVRQEPRVSSYHSRYKGEVHPKKRMRCRVKAVSLHAHN